MLRVNEVKRNEGNWWQASLVGPCWLAGCTGERAGLQGRGEAVRKATPGFSQLQSPKQQLCPGFTDGSKGGREADQAGGRTQVGG